MTVASPTLCTYFIFLATAASESDSGSGASLGYGTCADSELDTSFECITQMPEFQENYLICNATVADMNLNEADIFFSAFNKQFRNCTMLSQLVSKCLLQNGDLIPAIEVCLTVTLMKQPCKVCQKLRAAHIIKPEAPFALNVTYQDKANEYFVQFSTAHLPGSYIHDDLIHEIAYRQQNKPWMTMKSNYVTLKILGQRLQPETTYEMKVRTKPNDDYFKGTWSEWSSSAYFNTSAKVPVVIDNNTVEMIISTGGFIVLFILFFLIFIFWKSRIKPVVWPTIPNHKKALHQFCHKLRKNSDASFFNPESFGYVHIHKVNSIQCKAEVDHCQPSLSGSSASWLPQDVDDPEKTGNGLEQNNLIHINQGWLKLPLAYEGMWSAETRLNRRPSASDGNTCSSANLNDDSSHALGNGSTPSLDPTILSGLEAGICHSLCVNVQTGTSNIEEAYVTMASFIGRK
ncbi:interleukin-7 receptor subunit alpha [Varanus komodoensis]|uniref:interleukin-7 receptor subunit alpha n=1 Tax=Varanus komodoensis TaxID=61221 RepID=UPI001CF78412|nr:interleukin-7 receptor subunit alpha [Varanus komodoensis]